MKRLLSLMLVLGLASVANALVIKISVNGVVEPPDSAITIKPSNILTLDIWCTSGWKGSADDQYWALVCNTADGVINFNSGVILKPPAPSFSMYDSPVFGGAAANGFIGLLPGEEGSWGTIAGSPAGEPPGYGIPGTYYGEILFHCERAGDAVIRLITSPNWINWAVADTQVIHQVPEPTSMLLLSLGGLLLRRRK